MKKRFTTLLLLILLLTGCGTATEPQGIYYPPLSHTFLSNTLLPRGPSGGFYRTSCYVDSSSLYYNESVYTRITKYMEYSKNDLPLEELLGEELCTIYGNQARYWSVTEEKLAECTITGTLYQLNGYDEKFRVCLYFEEPANVSAGQGATYYLYIFERTNNITLYTGKDYYTDLFHFPEDTTLNNLDMEDTEVSAFIDALLEAEFIDPYAEGLPSFDYMTMEDVYYLSFKDSLGIINAIEIYENGYVVDKEDHNFILRLDPTLCQSIIDKIHEPEWAGNYFYNTYTYDNNRSSIRTKHTYRLDITETDTHLTFNLHVQRTDEPLDTASTPIDISPVVGPAATISVSKEEIGHKHIISLVSQPFPETAPELITYIELKKGTEENVIYLRYANSEEELLEENYLTLNKQ